MTVSLSHSSANRFSLFPNIAILNFEILKAINLVVYIRSPSEYRYPHRNSPNIPARKENTVFLLPLESSKKGTEFIYADFG